MKTKSGFYLKTVLSEASSIPEQQSTLFALLNLGILDSLTSGVMSATDALRIFFNAENCLFIHQQLHDRTADAIMSHGVQLPDLFDALPPEEAQREFQRELAKMRTLCLALLEEKQLAA
jgi:hypothetical protein